MYVPEQIADIHAINLVKNPSVTYQTLKLTIIESSSYLLNSTILVSPYTINEKDYEYGTKVLFGKDDVNNHYNFPPEEGTGTKQFDILYNELTNKYTLKDKKLGTGVFYRIDRFHKIDQNIISSFGLNHVFIRVVENDILEIKCIYGEMKNQVFTFNPREKNIVRIGRNKINDIIYSSDSVSRIQCTFAFDQHWYLYDGTLESPSTNGVWILASKRVDMYDSMIIKAGKCTMVANII